MDYTLEDLYGVDLEEYCRRHGTDIDKLINKTKTDLELLKENLTRLVRDKNDILDYKITVIRNRIIQKEEQLKRLKYWKKRYKG